MIISILSMAIMIGYLCVLVAGLIVSKNNLFLPGIVSFLLLLANQILQFINPFTNVIDTYILNGTESTFGLTIGEFAVLFSFLPRVLELIAVGILVVGLSRRWSPKFQGSPKT